MYQKTVAGQQTNNKKRFPRLSSVSLPHPPSFCFQNLSIPVCVCVSLYPIKPSNAVCLACSPQRRVEVASTSSSSSKATSSSTLSSLSLSLCSLSSHLSPLLKARSLVLSLSHVFVCVCAPCVCVCLSKFG